MTRRSLVLLACAALFLVAPPTKATDYVAKRIYCPREIRIQVDFVKDIGSNPTFTEGSSSYTSPTARLTRISRDGQKISCSYAWEWLATGRHALYSYKVHRKILDCKPSYSSYSYLDCRLEP